MTIYKANKFYGLPALVIPLLLIIPLINSDVSSMGRITGFGLFMLITCAILFLPFVVKLEVGDGYIKSYLFGFLTLVILSKDVLSIKYGNLFRGGLGHGKGLNILFLKDGKNRSTSLGEKLWGKEAIAHIRRVLGDKG